MMTNGTVSHVVESLLSSSFLELYVETSGKTVGRRGEEMEGDKEN